MISDSLTRVVERHRDRLAIIDGDQRITYGDFFERVQAVREWLRNALHPKAGDVIAASLDNSWQFVACLFAVSELGCIFMPCNPQWRAAELRPLARRVGFRGVIIEPRLSVQWEQVRDLIPSERVLRVDHAPAQYEPDRARGFPPADTTDDDASVLYLATSGSMGAPRLVPRTHRNLIANAESVAGTVDIGPGRRLLGLVPFHYSYGVNNSMLVPLLAGATVVIMPKFSPGACAELVHREQIDTLFGSPFLYGSLLESVREPALLSSLQCCFTGGGRTPLGIVQRWRDRFGTALRQFCGMSEAGVVALERAESAPGSSVGTCVGEPARGVEVAVLGADGVKLRHCEIGELAIRSAGVTSGYLGEPELNSGRFQHGYFRTGDLGYLDSSGKLYLTGRIGRVMNIAGVKVDPVEVERAVEMLAGVASCHVDTAPNGRGDDVIRARIVPRQGFQVTRRQVIEQCRQRLADYKFPRVIEFLEQSPVTIAGKVPRPVAADATGRS
jgi:acyl-CoA synthetase (AMP-forming)/AMP-acid ligase II